MPLVEVLKLHNLTAALEFIGALVIFAAAFRAAFALRSTPRNLRRARLIVAEGAISGLTLKLAATLLKTIELGSWHQILIFTIGLALRTTIKAEFQWQLGRAPDH